MITDDDDFAQTSFLNILCHFNDNLSARKWEQEEKFPTWMSGAVPGQEQNLNMNVLPSAICLTENFLQVQKLKTANNSFTTWSTFMKIIDGFM